METAALAVAGEEETRMIPVMAGAAALEGAAVQTIPETEEEAPAVAAAIPETAVAVAIPETAAGAAAIPAVAILETEAAALILIPIMVARVL